MNSKQRLRARIVLICIIAAAVALVGSLYWIQLVQGSSYASKAASQYVKSAASSFDRGTIYFVSKDGTRAAAATVSNGYLAYMSPILLTDAATDYTLLSQYMPLDKAAFMAKATTPDDHYEVLAEHLDAATAASIQALALTGVSVVPESWRSYPGGQLAAHVLGLVAENSDSGVAGRYGLELQYQDVLNRTGLGLSVNAFAQLFSGLGSVFGSGSASQGDIVTTIEPTVQAYLEQELASTSAEWHPSEIGGIVMDPQTGDIVAMASLPTYDPNDTSDVTDVSIFTDPLVEHVYEMGSIMKPLTMAMALDTEVEQPDSTYDDVGCLVLDTRKICNYDGKARGVIPMQQILSQSLNIGAATIAMNVEHKYPGDMLKYFSSYGIGSTTGIDLPNEATGIIDNLKTASDISIATAAYGQGIALSPVAMTRALAVLANGGYLVTPHLVSEIDHTDGTVQTMPPPPKVGPVLKPQTVIDVDNMLSIVADDALAYGADKMQHYTFGAKTGTAEIPDPVNGGYYPGQHYLHSFMGFFPVHSARFIIFLYQIYPKGAEYASETLTDPYVQLMKFLINYYNIPPDR